VIVGAGFSGMYMLHKLRALGFSVRVLETGSDVGGTWYWNRYPGARCDVPSIEYSYSFSRELEQNWEWTEVMAAQPEILKYANHVASRFSLRSDIEFDTQVISADYNEATKKWDVSTNTGKTFTAQFCIMAVGCLSAPNKPSIDNLEIFEGPVYHTGQWPHEGVDFSDVNVGVIGTGSSGIQAIPEIAKQAKHLTVFQRTANYTIPAGNAPLSNEYRQRVKKDYPEIRQNQRYSDAGITGYGYGFGGQNNDLSAFSTYAQPATELITDTTKKERMAQLDKSGFAAIFRFADVKRELQANLLGQEMYREQLRRVVHDPDTADKLCPTGYPIGCKRQVIDTGYFEAYNRSNVELIDLRKGGITAIAKDGIETEQVD
jgi:cyclohexanone monooxygenase